MSSIPPLPNIPSTPDPQMVALVFRLVRAVLTMLGAVGITYGASLNDPTLTIIASALVEIAMVIWTVIEWVKNARATHDVAVASAAVGRPVRPTVSVVR